MSPAADGSIRGFPPVAAPNARVLILGSVPSVASLQKSEYYGLPRNAFWSIMGDLFGAGRDVAYSRRLEILIAHRIALWDVLDSCHRPGSLDSSIDVSTARPNDFATFLGEHAGIRQIFFNGRKAEALFERKVQPDLAEPWASLPRMALPSTSPAHAAMSYADKRERWRAVAEPLPQRADEAG